jgi:hypothetical protein
MVIVLVICGLAIRKPVPEKKIITVAENPYQLYVIAKTVEKKKLLILFSELQIRADLCCRDIKD